MYNFASGSLLQEAPAISLAKNKSSPNAIKETVFFLETNSSFAAYLSHI